MKTKMSNTSKVIREWLHEYKSLPEAEMHTYASTIRANDELITSLYQLFEDDELPQEVADPVCHQLFDFYRSGRPELQRFTLELVPLLVLTYLTGIANNDKKKCGGIEACLLGIYNLEITDKDGNAKMSRFTIPSIACPSIYHEPPSLATLALTESALMCYHSDEHIVINVGPLPQVESTNAQNRLKVLTHVMSRYNRDVANLSPRSHQTLCKMCTRLAKMGFEQGGADTDSDSVDLNDSFSSTSSRGSQRRGVHFVSERRVTLSSQFLIELLTSIYFVMFNGHARLGTTAMEALDERAMYEMWPDTLLVTNAIKNSLMYNPSGQPMDGPMGISIALSPTTSNPSFSKHAITNASFRAKKLPEDIPIPDVDMELDTSAAKGSRVDGDILMKPDEKGRQKKGGDKRGEKEKKSKKADKDKDHTREKITVSEKKSSLDMPDDIEVPDSPENEAAPPTYDDIVEQERSKAEVDKSKPSNMFAKPLKSIMKSSKDKIKMNRKESDSRGRKDSTRDVPDSHSPRQSAHMATSQSLNLSQSLSNGANPELDLDMISVSVVRSSSRSKVDQIELRSATGMGSDHQRSLSSLDPDTGHHRRTSSFPEGGFSTTQTVNEYAASTTCEATKPLLSSNQGSQSNVNGANESDDESIGFTTQL